MGHEYFKELDENLSKNFRIAIDKGNKIVRQLQKEKSEKNIVTVGRVTYDLNTLDGLDAAFPVFSKSATLVAMATLIVRLSQIEASLEDVLISYMGLTAVYVDVASRYSENALLKTNSPAKNDAMDLLHLLYLKNDYSRYIVSDDKIFAKYFPDNTLPLNAVFAQG